MTPYLTRSDVQHAANIAGAHLDALGQSDLGKLTPEQYLTFACILVNEANKAAGDRIVSAWTIPVGAEG